MTKRMLKYLAVAVVVGLVLLAAHSVDLIGLIKTMHGAG
jgi:hypothetical protein